MAEEEKPAQEEKKGKGLIFIIVGVIVVMLLLVGVVAFLFMGGSDEEGSKESGGHSTPAPQLANLTPEQQALLQNEALKNPVAILPLEKEFIVNLKSPNPENLREGGFAKFRVALVLGDKNTTKEVEAKLDIVRTIIQDATTSFLATEVQSAAGRAKLSNSIVGSLNSVLTDGRVAAVVFPDFIIQP